MSFLNSKLKQKEIEPEDQLFGWIGGRYHVSRKKGGTEYKGNREFVEIDKEKHKK